MFAAEAEGTPGVMLEIELIYYFCLQVDHYSELLALGIADDRAQSLSRDTRIADRLIIVQAQVRSRHRVQTPS